MNKPVEPLQTLRTVVFTAFLSVLLSNLWVGTDVARRSGLYSGWYAMQSLLPPILVLGGTTWLVNRSSRKRRSNDSPYTVDVNPR